MRRKYILIIIAFALLLVGCSKGEGDSSEGSTDNNQDNSGSGVYPLTGIETTEGANNQIVGVMVNNHPVARPQSGLHQADVVFEILAEGDVTRFLALYQSEEPEVVGPVRSAREYYFELASGYDALYVYHGAANFVQDMIDTRGIEYLNGSNYDNDGILFERADFRKAPHNSYLQFDAVSKEAEEKGYTMTTENAEPFDFLEEDDTPSGEEASRIEVSYQRGEAEDVVEYHYDSGSEHYTRYDNKEQTVDLNTEEEIAVENVLVIETSHRVIDEEGRRDIDLEAGGKGYLFQKGVAEEVEWTNEEGKIVPVKDGEVIPFAKGKTWINVVPSNPGIEQSVIHE